MLIIALFIILIAIALPTVHASSTVLLRTTSITLIISAILAFNAVSNYSYNTDIILYSGVLHISPVVLFIDILVLVAGSIAIIPWAPSVFNIRSIIASSNVSTYPLFVLFTTIGGTCLISSSDLITLYISIELQSFAVYIIASVLYRNSETATHASLLYFMLGGLSSSIILLGCAFIYEYTGHTSLDNIFHFLSISNNIDNNIIFGIGPAALGFSLMAIGFFFKITAAPFHNWGPDVYDGVPTITATWLAVIPKISILGFLLNLQLGLGGISLEVYINNVSYDVWNILFLIVSFLSLLVGTIVGLAQTRIKRLLAYSTISHVGFILLALSVYSEEATEAFIFYIFQYTFTGLNAFFIILAIGYVININSSNKNQYSQDITYIKELSGIFSIHPFLAISIGISLFSIAGVPPLVGFFGKQGVLYSAINSGYIFISVIAVIVSVISASYYLRIIRIVHFDKQVETSSISIPATQIPLTQLHSYVIATLTSGLTFFMVSPDIILNSIRLIALSLYHL